MKKHKKTVKQDNPVAVNPVAKYAFRFNSAAVHRDKSKYSRKTKHKNTDCLPIVSGDAIGKQSVSFFLTV